MPKATFYNLSEEKQARILEVLKHTFQTKTIFEANVKEIVEASEIARGSFYQYFENLEEAYFTILDRETVDIHDLFMALLTEQEGDVFAALEEYGDRLAEILFVEGNYGIYKNRFLYWTPGLEEGWQAYRKSAAAGASDRDRYLYREEMQFIKAVVHNLIQRNFLERWDAQEFVRHYKQYAAWLKGGVHIDGTR